MPADVSTWLREQREARGWTRSEMARQLIQAGRARGDRQLPGLDGMCHNIYRWERGGPLSERYRLHYCRAFGIQPAQFAPGPVAEPAVEPAVLAIPAVAARPGMPVAYGEQAVSAAVPARPVPALPVSGFPVYREAEGPGLGAFSVEREVLMAAHEGSEHAERAERRDIGPATMEQLRADVRRLSTEFMTGEPLASFLEMRRVRARIFRILDQQLWPRDQADLYFLLGCLADLMAAAASDLGYPQAAEELLRSGWAYASAIDHRPLMAHLRLQLADNSYWYNQPQQARDLAEDGLRYLGKRPNAAHLHLRYATAAAQLGDADGAYRAISQSCDARERAYTDDVLEIGGEFAISRASHLRDVGGALTGIEGAEREAIDGLERAVAAYEAGRAGEQHGFAGKPLAGIDLASIHLRSGALDAATTTLTPVLALPPAQRVNALTSRLRLVRAELHRPLYGRSAQARELDGQIEEFGRDTMPAGLHSLPGAPSRRSPPLGPPHRREPLPVTNYLTDSGTHGGAPVRQAAGVRACSPVITTHSSSGPSSAREPCGRWSAAGTSCGPSCAISSISATGSATSPFRCYPSPPVRTPRPAGRSSSSRSPAS